MKLAWPKTSKDAMLTWLSIAVIFVCMALSRYLADMVIICCHSGRDAYFKNGIRIVKHKPHFVLSTGDSLPSNLEYLHYWIEGAIWITSIIACLFIVAKTSAQITRHKSDGETANP